MKTVVLYGRAGCCLCDDAREVLERVRSRRPFELCERDIESDDALLRAYLERIPVVTIDGVEAFQYFVDEAALEAAVSSCSSSIPVAASSSESAMPSRIARPGSGPSHREGRAR